MHTLPQHRQLDIYDGDENDDNADDQLYRSFTSNKGAVTVII